MIKERAIMNTNCIAEFNDIDGNMKVFICNLPNNIAKFAVSIKDLDSGNYLDVMYHYIDLDKAITRALELANLKPVKSTVGL